MPAGYPVYKNDGVLGLLIIGRGMQEGLLCLESYVS